jgi:hypothetical protein
MTLDSKLPQWDGSGHLTDLALVALADGQDALVDADARAHADSCAACAERLADLALESIAVGEAMAIAREPRRLPAKAIAIAATLALLGVIPSLLEPRWLSNVVNAPHKMFAFVGAIAQLSRAFGHAPMGTVATFTASLLLISVGVLVARQKRLS